MDQKRVGSKSNCRERNNNRVYVHRCESNLGEKKVEKREKSKRKEGNGLWNSLKSGVLGVSKLGFLSSDEYNQKVEKLEMVFSSVSLKVSSFSKIFILSSYITAKI